MRYSPQPRFPRGRPSERGFTFVELLIAGFLSLLVILSVYFVFIGNAAQYYVQEQVVQMQEGMRFALEYLKNDLRNAGRLSVVNAIQPANGDERGGRDPQFCPYRSELQGIELIEDHLDNPAILTRHGNGLSPDRIRLLIDASGAIPLHVASSAGDSVTLAPASEQRTRDARQLANSRARFEAAFKTGFYLYVVARSGASDLVGIDSVRFDRDGSAISLQDDLCRTGLAEQCFAGDCIAAPVQLVEYAVITDEENRSKTDLVRQVIDVREDLVMDNLSVIIAEYVVDLQLWGVYDTRNADGLPGRNNRVEFADDDDPTDDIGNWDTAREEDAMNEQPERIRAFYIHLATRTPREDPGFVVAPDIDTVPSNRIAADRTWFNLNDVPGTGMCRVATMHSAVEAPNLYRGAQ